MHVYLKQNRRLGNRILDRYPAYGEVFRKRSKGMSFEPVNRVGHLQEHTCTAALLLNSSRKSELPVRFQHDNNSSRARDHTAIAQYRRCPAAGGRAGHEHQHRSPQSQGGSLQNCRRTAHVCSPSPVYFFDENVVSLKDAVMVGRSSIVVLSSRSASLAASPVAAMLTSLKLISNGRLARKLKNLASR